jgi:peroxiredoxin
MGIDEIMIYCVNDAAVMKAWAKDQKIEDTIINFYGDPTGNFTKACGMNLDDPGVIGKGLLGRCKRFLLYIDNGVVKYSVIAEDVDYDPAGDDFPEKVLPDQSLAAIKAVQQG